MPDWREADGGIRLVGAHCSACDLRFFPHREICPRCGALEGVAAADLSPRGRLYSYSNVHVAPAQFQTPYVVGFVDFEDDVRVFGQIEGDPATLTVEAEMAVTVGVVRREGGDEILGYKFRRADR